MNSIQSLSEARNDSPQQTDNPEIEWLLQVFQDHLGYLEEAVANIPDERFVDQPNGLVNHPAWSLSHLKVSLQFLLGLLDEPQVELSQDHQSRFGPGSIPSTHRCDYASKTELCSELKRLHALTDATVRAKHASYFPRQTPIEIREFAPTIGRIAFYLLASHEAYHLAQINQWRRAAGDSTLT